MNSFLADIFSQQFYPPDATTSTVNLVYLEALFYPVSASVAHTSLVLECLRLHVTKCLTLYVKPGMVH